MRLIRNGSTFLLLFRVSGDVWTVPLSESGFVGPGRQLLASAPGQFVSYESGASNGDGFVVVAGRTDADRMFLFDRDGELRSAATFDEGLRHARIAGVQSCGR